MHLKTRTSRLCAFVLLFVPCLAFGVTFKVDNTQDLADANPGDGICSHIAIPNPDDTSLCTLRAAVMEGNGTPIDQDVNVELAPGATYTFTVGGAEEFNAASGDLNLKRLMTIGIPEGASPHARIDANLLSRAFQILPGAGGSRLYGIEIVNARSSTPASALGVWIMPGVESVVLEQVQISGSIKDSPGAGCALEGAVNLIDSRIYANGNAESYVHGICAFSEGFVWVTRSTVDGNSGSGINIQNGGSAFVAASTVSANGKGIMLLDASANVLNSTIALNREQQMVFQTSIAGEFALKIYGSILQSADGTSDVCEVNHSSPDTITTFETGWNIYSDSSCISDVFFDNSMFDTAIKLSDLDAWGGLTPTHVPASNSKAIDMAPGGFCTFAMDVDQRGLSRPVSLLGDETFTCDIGAVELQSLDEPGADPGPAAGGTIFGDGFEAM